jgi:hypothetical protein
VTDSTVDIYPITVNGHVVGRAIVQPNGMFTAQYDQNNPLANLVQHALSEGGTKYVSIGPSLGEAREKLLSGNAQDISYGPEDVFRKKQLARNIEKIREFRRRYRLEGA